MIGHVEQLPLDCGQDLLGHLGAVRAFLIVRYDLIDELFLVVAVQFEPESDYAEENP